MTNATLGDARLKKLGLIVNPIAGMGGRVGLKGTDGEDMRQRALDLGATPQAYNRAFEALSEISKTMPELSLITCAGPMGEDVAKDCGLSFHVIADIPKCELATSSTDTRRAVLEMQDVGVDLILFAGGDGTAIDICDVFASKNCNSNQTPVLGIPAGVKMHSGVFALTPRRAGETALRFIRGETVDTHDVEIMDIDEAEFRAGRLSATLRGYLKTPVDSTGIQSTKTGAFPNENFDLEGIARQVIADMDEDTIYIIGPGTTTAAISEALGIENTLLGVDVVLNGSLLAMDSTERDLIKLTEDAPTKIVVSVIGGQGYIFGRGNQQISPSVIRRVGRENVIVVATSSKLLGLGGRPLLVDTGDTELDEELSGYTKVVTGYRQSHVSKVSC